MINTFKRSMLTSKNTVKKKKNNQALRKKQPREAISIKWDNRMLMPVAVISIIVLIILMLPEDDVLPIEKIRLSGEFQYLDTSVIENKLQPQLGKGFFSVDISSIQDQISQQPWVKSVSVRRVWPNHLAVRVTERKAYARWDKDNLLSTEAVIFKANSDQFKHLPLINGYTRESKLLLQRYINLKMQLKQHGIQLNEMQEDKKGALTLLINENLRVSLGSENNREKIKHLLSVYPLHIKPMSEHVKHIDFRYSNGFVIAWKKEYLEKIGKLHRSNRNV